MLPSTETPVLVLGMSDTTRPLLLIGFIALMFVIAGVSLVVGKRRLEKRQALALSQFTGTKRGVIEGADQSYDETWLAEARAADDDDDEDDTRSSWAHAILGHGVSRYDDDDSEVPPELRVQPQSVWGDQASVPTGLFDDSEAVEPVPNQPVPTAPNSDASATFDPTPATTTEPPPVPVQAQVSDDEDEMVWDMGASDTDTSDFMSFDPPTEQVRFDEGPLVPTPDPKPAPKAEHKPEPEPEPEPDPDSKPHSKSGFAAPAFPTAWGTPATPTPPPAPTPLIVDDMLDEED